MEDDTIVLTGPFAASMADMLHIVDETKHALSAISELAVKWGVCEEPRRRLNASEQLMLRGEMKQELAGFCEPTLRVVVMLLLLVGDPMAQALIGSMGGPTERGH